MTKINITSDGRKGGLLYGPTDKDNGAGIQASVVGGGRVVVGGGEIIINEEAARKHCKELSEINESTGGRKIDCSLQKKANTGKLHKGGRIQVITEEEYLSMNGASRQDIGDSALHKNKGRNSDKTWKKIVDNQASKDRELLHKREDLRREYAAKVAAGELRPPTREEHLISVANGNPDNESVQAARRILNKKNINWEQKTMEKKFTFLSKSPMQQGKALARLKKMIRTSKEIIPLYQWVEGMKPGLEIGTSNLHSRKSASGTVKKLVIGDWIVSSKAEQDYYQYLQNGGYPYSKYLADLKSKKEIEDKEHAVRKDIEEKERRESNIRARVFREEMKKKAIKEILEGKEDSDYLRRLAEMESKLKSAMNSKQTESNKLLVGQHERTIEHMKEGAIRNKKIATELYKIENGEVVPRFNWKVGDQVEVKGWKTASGMVPTEIEEIRENAFDDSIQYKVKVTSDEIANPWNGYDGIFPIKDSTMKDENISHNAKSYLKMITEMYPKKFSLDTTQPSKDVNMAIAELEAAGLLKRLLYDNGFAEYGLSDKEYTKFKKGDKVSMFVGEPELSVVEVNEWADKLPTYDVRSEDGTIVRNNIPEDKIFSTDDAFAKAGAKHDAMKKTANREEKLANIMDMAFEEARAFLNELIKEQLAIYEEIKSKPAKVEIQRLLGIYFNLVSKNPNTLYAYLEDQMDLPPSLTLMAHYANDAVFSEEFKANLKSNVWDLIPEKLKEYKLPKRINYNPDPNDKNLSSIIRDFTGGDDLRVHLMGVNFDKDGITATDAHKLLFLSHPDENRTPGIYCMENDCLKANENKQVIDAKYPNYQAIIPRPDKIVSIHTESLIAYLKTVIKIKYFNLVIQQALVVFDSESDFAFNAHFLLTGLETMYKLGYDQIDICYSRPIRAIVICPKGKTKDINNFKTDFVLVMPLMIGNDVELNDGTMYYDAEYECVKTRGIESQVCISPMANQQRIIDKKLKKITEFEEKQREKESAIVDVPEIIESPPPTIEQPPVDPNIVEWNEAIETLEMLLETGENTEWTEAIETLKMLIGDEPVKKMAAGGVIDVSDNNDDQEIFESQFGKR